MTSLHTESQVLATMMDRARQYTLLYFNKLKDQDLHKRFVCEGKELNTPYWLIAHLATTENGLLLRSTGGEFIKFSWAKHFSLGGAGLPPSECPPFNEVFEVFSTVHAKAMAHLPTLDDAALSAPNTTGLPFGPQVRDVIMHAVRHESSHAGHMGWLCKLHGIKTM